MTTEFVVGVDVGTTTIKAIAVGLDGEVIATAADATQWDVDGGGFVETDVDRLADQAIAVIERAAGHVGSPGRAIGVGITGLAETGVLIDPRGRPVMPAMAWYDQRGRDELAALPAEVRRQFSAATGLAAKAECSFAKLLWRRSTGATIPSGAMWLNALEYIAYRLTGVRATEPSLASRTGLLHQATIAPYDVALELIGATPSLLPELVNAGRAVGRVSEAGPANIRGACVTVAGHDHLVGSVGAGAVGGDDLYNSCGTADVILRSVPRTLTDPERAGLVERGLSAGRHVLPGSTAILGATRSGLVLGRVLSMLGISGRDERRALSDRWDPGQVRSGVVDVSEPGAWTNEVTVSLRDDAGPQDVWAAAMAYVLGETGTMLDAVREVAGPYETAVAAGGWARLPGVFRGKASIMPRLAYSDVEEPGARGAAIFAAQAARVTNGALVEALPAIFIEHRNKELIS